MAEYTPGYKAEVPDPRPVEVPLDFRMPLSLAEEIKRMVRSELSLQAADQGFETFEEADDFNVGDDDDEFSSPYEMTEMQEEARYADASSESYNEGGEKSGKTVVSGPADKRGAEAGTEAAGVPEVRSGDGADKAEAVKKA